MQSALSLSIDAAFIAANTLFREALTRYSEQNLLIHEGTASLRIDEAVAIALLADKFGLCSKLVIVAKHDLDQLTGDVKHSSIAHCVVEIGDTTFDLNGDFADDRLVGLYGIDHEFDFTTVPFNAKKMIRTLRSIQKACDHHGEAVDISRADQIFQQMLECQ